MICILMLFICWALRSMYLLYHVTGPWSVIGGDALVLAESEIYTPDYSAYITSENFRCVHITLASADNMASAPRRINGGNGSNRFTAKVGEGKNNGTTLNTALNRTRTLSESGRNSLISPFHPNSTYPSSSTNNAYAPQTTPRNRNYNAKFKAFPKAPVNGTGGSSAGGSSMAIGTSLRTDQENGVESCSSTYNPLQEV